MKVIYSERARAALSGILGFIGSNYPSSYDAFRRQMALSLERIAQFPESAPVVGDRKDIRVVPLARYPYKLYFLHQRDLDLIEIVDIQHMARGASLDAD
jgi:plasmid stabilization system protein ParE